ncbi:sigma-70 family RNA polymerase sigma factor [Sphingomonas sp. EC-HK361]|uniref:sigma-70 family RNA polymerase sigma factor n=1 Tax=Sphingomonas sp. EC-HK361 TaxID=2038397 RepID=UPI001260081E|nr:sigma-70 family RNA polymerase sigma factor [Sphingomonas sp. EC-HK361]
MTSEQLPPAQSGPHSGQAADRAALVEALVATGAADRGAFQRVYRMTSAKLFGICLRICGERRAAEDVLQEVYAIVWRRAGAFQPGRASPITWLCTIARNRSIDWRRAQRTAPAPLLDEADRIADERPLADAALLRTEEAQRLHLCLDELEPRQQGAIRTAFFGGLTYSEIAEREGVPLSTMKSTIRRGLLRLRDCLNDAD